MAILRYKGFVAKIEVDLDETEFIGRIVNHKSRFVDEEDEELGDGNLFFDLLGDELRFKGKSIEELKANFRKLVKSHKIKQTKKNGYPFIPLPYYVEDPDARFRDNESYSSNFTEEWIKFKDNQKISCYLNLRENFPDFEPEVYNIRRHDWDIEYSETLHKYEIFTDFLEYAREANPYFIDQVCICILEQLDMLNNSEHISHAQSAGHIMPFAIMDYIIIGLLEDILYERIENAGLCDQEPSGLTHSLVYLISQRLGGSNKYLSEKLDIDKFKNRIISILAWHILTGITLSIRKLGEITNKSHTSIIRMFGNKEELYDLATDHSKTLKSLYDIEIKKNRQSNSYSPDDLEELGKLLKRLNTEEISDLFQNEIQYISDFRAWNLLIKHGFRTHSPIIL